MGKKKTEWYMWEMILTFEKMWKIQQKKIVCKQNNELIWNVCTVGRYCIRAKIRKSYCNKSPADSFCKA